MNSQHKHTYLTGKLPFIKQAFALVHHGLIHIPYISLIPLFFLFTLSCHATIHTVKQDGTGDYTTIQDGIDAATTGDTVLIWPGIYFENIDYNSKSITVASLYLTTQDDAYIHSTIIDGNMNDVGVKIINCTGESTVLNGMTVQHGFATTSVEAGGGIVVKGISKNSRMI